MALAWAPGSARAATDAPAAPAALDSVLQAAGAPVDSVREAVATPDSEAIVVRSNPREAHLRAAQRDSARAAAMRAPQRWSDQPRFVMMRSLVIPGWGQLYNRAYFKAGLVIGAEGWLIGALISDSHKLEDLQHEVDAAHASGDTLQADIATNAYNDRLNTFVGRQWLLAGVVVYALLDAYVDAHFKNFDIEFRPDAPAPGASGPTQRLDLRWKF